MEEVVDEVEDAVSASPSSVSVISAKGDYQLLEHRFFFLRASISLVSAQSLCLNKKIEAELRAIPGNNVENNLFDD